MQLIANHSVIPNPAVAYHGEEWFNVRLPRSPEPWLADGPRTATHFDAEEAELWRVTRYATGKEWSWPTRRVAFLSDVHADAEAFLLSLVASGGVRRFGPGHRDFTLTELGRRTLFILGGDCLDKGPSNLKLLRSLRHLLSEGASLKLLAGNHDLRTRLGLTFAGNKAPLQAHLFARLGRKGIGLLKEIFDEYVAAAPPASYLSERDAERLLLVDKQWPALFKQAAKGHVAKPKLKRELTRIQEKTEEIRATCKALGLTLGMLAEAVRVAQRLFLEPSGEFGWFFDRMLLAHQEASFLFVHAGVDDELSERIASGGVGALNREYRKLVERDLFGLYHGVLGNACRTKYRATDRPLTDAGRTRLFDAGIFSVVHGHRRTNRGPRVTLRAGLLHFECDASLDANTRAKAGLSGLGGSTVVFEPSGAVLSVSTDFPNVRVLRREELSRAVSFRAALPTGHATRPLVNEARRAEYSR